MGNLPGTLVIKEPIRPLFELLRDRLGLLMALEPGLVLLVEAPTLVLQCLGSQILLVGALSIIEDIEQGVCIDLPRLVQPRVVEDG